jgi:hypothetical protein
MKIIFKKATFKYCLIALIFFQTSYVCADDKAKQIMQSVHDRDDGINKTSDILMTLINKKGNKRIRKIKSYSQDKNKDTSTALFFMHPADIKDTALLTYDYDDHTQDDDQWMYLPALHKSKRISSNEKKSSFVGSDFSYGDLTKFSIELYDYELLKEKIVNTHKTWVIQVTPKNKKTINKYGYTKSIVFVRQDNDIIIRAVHWVKKGKKLKYYEVTNIEQINDIWLETEIIMTTKKGKKTLHKTIINKNNITVNQNKLGDDFFTVRQIEKGI